MSFFHNTFCMNFFKMPCVRSPFKNENAVQLKMKLRHPVANLLNTGQMQHEVRKLSCTQVRANELPFSMKTQYISYQETAFLCYLRKHHTLF